MPAAAERPGVGRARRERCERQVAEAQEAAPAVAQQPVPEARLELCCRRVSVAEPPQAVPDVAEQSASEARLELCEPRASAAEPQEAAPVVVE